VARRFIPEEEPQTTLFTLGRYAYRAWGTKMDLTPVSVWYFYDGRAGMEPRIWELRSARSSPPRLRLMHSTGKSCGLTLQKLCYKWFLLPSELTGPQNHPILRLRGSPILRDLAHETLEKPP